MEVHKRSQQPDEDLTKHSEVSFVEDCIASNEARAGRGRFCNLSRHLWLENRTSFVLVLVLGLCILATVLVLWYATLPSSTSGEAWELDVNTAYNAEPPSLPSGELAEAAAAYHARRKALLSAKLSRSKDTSTGEMALRAFLNASVSVSAVTNVIAELKTSETADFAITHLLRLMAYTQEFDNILLPALRDVISWPEEGNSNTLYVYWSENHMAMWLSAIQLMHEWHGLPVQEGHNMRLRKFLSNKIEHGFIEFYSVVYMPFTFAALANICDFSTSVTLRELACGAALRLLRDLDVMTNDRGGTFAVAGRNYRDYVESTSHTLHTMGWILTGRGQAEDLADLAFGVGAVALVTTSLDVTEVLSRPFVWGDLSWQAGHSRDEFDEVWGDLDKHSRQLVAMGMGGYAHPDYVTRLFETLDYYALWDSQYFGSFQSLRSATPGMLRALSNIVSSWGSGTLLYAQVVLHKRGGSMLSTLQDYHKGLNGEQQWPFVATAGTAPVYIGTGGMEGRNPSSHFPFAKQRGNVAIMAYMPNSDLRLFGGNLDVTLVWPEESFSEPSREEGQWLVGREEDSYVAIYRGCEALIKRGRISCNRNVVWACVVGHNETHGSYDEFIGILKSSTVEDDFTGGCLTATVCADNQTVSIHWCQERTAPTTVALIVGIIFVVVAIGVMFFACLTLKVLDKEGEEDGNGMNPRPKGGFKHAVKFLGCLKTRTGIAICIVLTVVGVFLLICLLSAVLFANNTHKLSSDQ